MTAAADLKVGDRVRATLGENVLVGRVVMIGANPATIRVEPDGAGHYLWLTPSAGWQIEKVSPPLPTKVGAIIRTEYGEYYVRGDNSVEPWMFLSASKDDATNWAADEDFDGSELEVIFEGVDL